MMALSARYMGFRIGVLDPTPDCPTAQVADFQVTAEYDDIAAIRELAEKSDVLTYEFENVDADAIDQVRSLAAAPQGTDLLRVTQDRVNEKRFINDHGTPTAPWKAVNSVEELEAALDEIHYPAVLKTRSGGYDGHGQRVLKTEADIAGALPLLAVPCILEEFVPFDSEASIVMVADGERVVSFPVGRNVHRDGILDLCIVPAEVDSGVLARMKAQSERFMRDCGYRGILAIEYFIKGGEIYFNEMAPRPHNSGHYTIEGATTNQFRELVRYLVGEPLQEPQPVAPTVMKNILGQDLEAAERIAAENLPGVYVHLYGKTESRPKRKMGHITFVGMDAARFEAEWAGRFVK